MSSLNLVPQSGPLVPMARASGDCWLLSTLKFLGTFLGLKKQYRQIAEAQPQRVRKGNNVTIFQEIGLEE